MAFSPSMAHCTVHRSQLLRPSPPEWRKYARRTGFSAASAQGSRSAITLSPTSQPHQTTSPGHCAATSRADSASISTFHSGASQPGVKLPAMTVSRATFRAISSRPVSGEAPSAPEASR